MSYGRRCQVLAALLPLALASCSVDKTTVRKLQPGVYEVTRLDCHSWNGSDQERLRAAVEQRATRYCPAGYQLSDLELTNSGMGGSAVLGECVTVTLRAVVHCDAVTPR